MANHTSYLFYLKTLKQTASEAAVKAGGEVVLPIYFRITVNGKRAEISTGEFVAETNWNRHKNRLKGLGGKAQVINARLDGFLNEAKKASQYLTDKNKPVSALSIKNQMLGKGIDCHGIVQCFRNFVDDINRKLDIEYKVGTLRNYKVTQGHLEEFVMGQFQNDDYPLKDLNHKFITDFELMCKTSWGCKNSTAVKHVQRIRKVIGVAVANDWIDKDPFQLYKGKQEKATIKFLTQDELMAIQQKVFSIDRLRKVRDIFIFSCYTGYPYSDVKKFSPQDIVIGMDGLKWIYTSRAKNDNESNVPLLPQALAILEKYKADPDVINGNKLLPVISNMKTNAYLKEIAELCGVRKNLTFHMARHTFATTITLTNGVPIETVSAMLGHKSLRTTQIYAKVIENKVSTDMLALRDKLMPKVIDLKNAEQNR